MKGTSRSGDIAECVGIALLLRDGYEVFRNVSCCGPIDVIIVDTKTGDLTKIDMKKYQPTMHRPAPYVVEHRDTIAPTITKSQELRTKLEVKLLAVDADNLKYYWLDDNRKVKPD